MIYLLSRASELEHGLGFGYNRDTAALQGLAARFAPPADAAAEVAELKAIEASEACGIRCSHNAPYLVTNVANLENSRFRVHAEPFIDLSGADTDAIIAQVRACPSGALSYAIDGVESRDQERRPTVTVSKDGPYRVTGGVELPDEQRAEGASTEHYALCRCGGSKNNPFLRRDALVHQIP